ncbi:hypothetical protein DTO166G4_1375 [Paecilomyces variotii]|nr:hypothetical protein DTO166G4_1375 [Paecilomyces variotii]KAJ9237515.1 hypothetical protein DTO169E5_5101 [Paecilomyces variotii]KAJ9242745.1 hypothetical protein DTO166G5_500 [Paecilomyces variotii]KAJ9258427.1 hypothetical protein DTO207G8_1602 [Paecilomyces variotii]KAJ9266456.1 hypothetical protein DTO195F2_979 [Paecilomyces variotii]
MLVSLTVGKVDAGVAVLLTQDNRLIEFPSVLLPSNITSGSIVDITVSRNHAAEAANIAAFQALQKRILNTYGLHTPSPPVLRLRNATQTSLVLEWDPIDLATASLKSLSLYRNGSKAGSIPRPLEMLSTKISGLAIHTEYTFHLVLRTTAGTFQSEKLVCRTHKMTDLSGITVTPGIMPPQQKDALAAALDRIGGKLIDTVRIDTTHFVCTEGRGPLWEKAVEMNIPVVRPEWVDACEAEGTIVSVRGYYLNADPKLRQIGHGPAAQQRQRTSTVSTMAPSTRTESQTNLPSRPAEPSVPEAPTTPFPGAETNGHAKELESQDETPPPPPAKDEAPVEKEEPKEQSKGEEQNGTHVAEPDSHAENGVTEEKEAPAEKADTPDASDQKKAKGTEGDEKLDEVPL